MNDLEAEKMERVIRNTPAVSVNHERIDGEHGEILFAYGPGPDGTIYAIWGCCGLARTVEFPDGTKVEEIRQILVNDAAEVTNQRAERGLIGETQQ